MNGGAISCCCSLGSFIVLSDLYWLQLINLSFDWLTILQSHLLVLSDFCGVGVQIKYRCCMPFGLPLLVSPDNSSGFFMVMCLSGLPCPSYSIHQQQFSSTQLLSSYNCASSCLTLCQYFIPTWTEFVTPIRDVSSMAPDGDFTLKTAGRF